MSLRIDQVFSVWCDFEDEPCAAHTATFETPEEAEAEARKEHWIEDRLKGYGSLWYCPKHGKRRKEE
jgi:hypothetical protein